MTFAGFLHGILLLVSNFVSYFLPAYFSFKALEAHTGLEKWLTYWIVLALFSVIELWAYIVVSRIPFYQVLKFIFVVWLQLPQTQGAYHCYVKVILPLLKQHQAHIDQYIEASQSKLEKQMTSLGFMPQPTPRVTSDFPVSSMGGGLSHRATGADIESTGPSAAKVS